MPVTELNGGCLILVSIATSDLIICWIVVAATCLHNSWNHPFVAASSIVCALGPRHPYLLFKSRNLAQEAGVLFQNLPVLDKESVILLSPTTNILLQLCTHVTQVHVVVTRKEQFPCQSGHEARWMRRLLRQRCWLLPGCHDRILRYSR